MNERRLFRALSPTGGLSEEFLTLISEEGGEMKEGELVERESSSGRDDFRQFK